MKAKRCAEQWDAALACCVMATELRREGRNFWSRIYKCKEKVHIGRARWIERSMNDQERRELVEEGWA